MTTTTTKTLNPQVLGQAENAHRALLDRMLTGSGLTSRDWVALSLAVAGNTAIGRDELIKKATSALKIDEATAHEVIAELTAMQLLEVPPGDPPSVQLTAAGRELQRKLRTDINRAVSDLYSDIPSDELATAGRVLTVITDRINSELARDRLSAPDREPDARRSL